MLAHVRELIEPDGVAYVSTPNVLTLAPEGRRALRQPVARARVQAGRVPRAVRAPLRPASTCSGLFHARKLRAHQVAIERLGWDRVHKAPAPHASRSTTASRPRSRARDFTLPARRPGPQPRPAGGAAAVKRLSIVLHTHMPYVEGFGTWPFGEEWLWEAIATSYLPLLDVLDAHPGQGHALDHARCSPTSSRRRARSSAAWRSCARSGPRRTRSTCGDDAARRRSSTPRARYAAAADALERRGDLIAAFAPHVTLDERRHPRRAPAAGHRRRRPAAARDRDRVAPRAASAPGTAASGCPSARTRRGSTSCSRRPACT